MTDTLVFDRHRRLPYLKPSENGRLRCRACEKEIPSGSRRTSFCTRECAEKALIVSSGSYARSKVEERDHGVCASCGMDTEYVKRTLEPLLSEAASSWRSPLLGNQLRHRVFEELLALGFSGTVATGASVHFGRSIRVHLWEMDHLIPVINGGGACGLENLRTLCRVCHGRATAKLAAERAKNKRVSKKQAGHEARMAAKRIGIKVVKKKWRR